MEMRAGRYFSPTPGGVMERLGEPQPGSIQRKGLGSPRRREVPLLRKSAAADYLITGASSTTVSFTGRPSSISAEN
jgi:hypothetical protein